MYGKDNQFSSLLQCGNMALQRLCSSCNNKFSSSQSLWNHRKRCPLKRLEDSNKNLKQASVSNLKVTNLAVKDLTQKGKNMDKILSDSTKVKEKQTGHCLNISGKKRRIMKNDVNDNRKKIKVQSNSEPIINTEPRKVLHSYVSKNSKTPQKSFDCNFHEKIDTKQEKVEKDSKPLDLNKIIKSYVSKDFDSPKVYPSSDIKVLRERLSSLYGELCAGNINTKPQIIDILEKLYQKGAINEHERDSTIDVIEDKVIESDDDINASDEETSDEESSNESDNLDFFQLVQTTIDNLTRNARQNLNKLIKKVDKNIQTRVSQFLNKKETIEAVKELLVDNPTHLRIKILLKDIANTRERVTKILNALRNVKEEDKMEVLDNLRTNGLISDSEYKRLVIANHDVMNFAKVIQGSGLYI